MKTRELSVPFQKILRQLILLPFLLLVLGILTAACSSAEESDLSVGDVAPAFSLPSSEDQ
ncbi:MAG: hypothetical protein GTO18_07680 [Anaerolineales bacterium]|nr:hypothetical protein [Anaerolineales bacterium]